MSLGMELLHERLYFHICYRIAHPKHLHKDLYQEAYLGIYSKPYDLNEFKERGQLPSFFAGFAWKTFHSDVFKKKYDLTKVKYEFSEWMDVKEEEYDTTSDEKIDRIIYEIVRPKEKERDQYLDLLFKRYLECGESGYVVSSTYDIPARTVFSGLKEYKEKIKTKYEDTGKG